MEKIHLGESSNNKTEEQLQNSEEGSQEQEEKDISTNGEENNQTDENQNLEGTEGKEVSYANISNTDRIKNTYSFIIPASR